MFDDWLSGNRDLSWAQGARRARSQVGIGTLIVFTGMIIVAVIAGGVLIETADFLQSDAEATGEESSQQVTNGLQVQSAIGDVTDTANPTTDTIRIENYRENFGIVQTDFVDSGATLPASVSGGDESVTFTSSGGSAGDLVVEDGDSVRFEEVGSNTLQLTNVDTDTTISFDTRSESLTVKEGDGGSEIRFDYEFEDVYVDTTIKLRYEETTGGDDIEVGFDSRTRSFVELKGEGDIGGSTEREASIAINDGETVTVGGNTDDDLQNDDTGETLSISVGEELTFTPDPEDQKFTIANEAGATLDVGSLDQLVSAGSDTVELANDGHAISVIDNNIFDKTGDPNHRYVFRRDLPPEDQETDLRVSQLDLLVTASPGSGDIDLEESTVSVVSDDGQSNLLYGSSAIEDDTFNASVVKDDDDSFPVLSDSDRLSITIDPGTLEPGTELSVTVTTPSGTTTTERITVPASLTEEGAVLL